MAADFPQSVWSKGMQGRSHNVFYALVSQVTHDILLVTQASSVRCRRLRKGVDTGRQGSLGAVLKAGYRWNLSQHHCREWVWFQWTMGGYLLELLNATPDNRCKL